MGRWASLPLAVLGAACLGALLAVPSIRALPPDEPVARWEAEPYEPFVRPESEWRSVNVTLRFSCSAPEFRAVEPIEVNYRVVQAPETVTAALGPSKDAVVPANQTSCTDDQMRHEMKSRLSASVSRKAAAYEPLTVRTEARLTIRPAGGPAENYGPYPLNLTFQPAFVPRLLISPGAQIIEIEPGATAIFDVRLESLSNGASTVDLEVDLHSTRPAELEFPARTNLTNPLVESAGATASLQIAVTPEDPGGYVNEFMSLVATFRTNPSDARGGEMDEQQLPLSIQLKSRGGAAPAPTSLVVLGLLFLMILGEAWNRTRRRV